MELFAFLGQLQWYELVGGVIAAAILGIVAFYAVAIAAFTLLWCYIESAWGATVVNLAIIGSAGWFIFHLIQKYGS